MTNCNCSSMIPNLSLIKTSWWIGSLCTRNRNELPSIADYWELMFKRKQMKVWMERQHQRGHYTCLLKFFNANQKSQQRNNWLCHQACIHHSWWGHHEVVNEHKATYKHLSISGSRKQEAAIHNCTQPVNARQHCFRLQPQMIYLWLFGRNHSQNTVLLPY